MELPLQSDLKVGFTITMENPQSTQHICELAETNGFDSIWASDHILFTSPILDPLLQLAQIAAYTESIVLGTSIFLLPLRNPVIAAKQVTTLDHLCDGRFIFGVGVGGEFPGEYDACQIPVGERGARLSEQIPIMKALFRGSTSWENGRFYSFPVTKLEPSPLQTGGPPIWCGGRSPAALERIGHMADGWLAYVVTPERYQLGLERIAHSARSMGREISSFGTALHLFLRIGNDYESALDIASKHLSKRYAMDFRKAARKYAALGRPDEIAYRMLEFARSGVRHFVLDIMGSTFEQEEQLRRFSNEVRPVLDREWQSS